MEQSIWFQGKSIPNTSWRKYWTGQYLNNSNQTLFPYFLLNSPWYTINVYVCVCVCVYIYTLYTHISAELSGSLDPSDQVVCRERHKEQNCIPLCLFCLKCTLFIKYICIYKYISVFKLQILLKKNYTKHNVSRLMTILSSQKSLNHINTHDYIYIYICKAYNNKVLNIIQRHWTSKLICWGQKLINNYR